MKEEVVQITGDDGLVRRGIISMPENSNGIGILLLPAGFKYRVGPARFYVYLARYFADYGYTVFRFDPAGLGESDGDLPVLPVQNLWRTLEEGRFVDDALLAAKTMREKFDMHTVISGGICGGAITSQLAAAKDTGLIDGIISINTSVTLAGPTGKSSLTMGESQATKNYNSYIQKLFSMHAWKRFLSGQSDFITIFKTINTMVSAIFKKHKPENLEPLENENPNFVKSFRLLENKNIKHLLLFSGNDNRWSQFQDVILRRYLDNKTKHGGYNIEIIPEANHELHFREWQEKAIDIIKIWLSSSFSSEQAK